MKKRRCGWTLPTIRWRHLVYLFCLGLATSSTVAYASSCGQSGELPTFTATLDPNAVPSPSSNDDASLSSLELYRAKLEIYLQNTIEGYNRKLIAFGENLNMLDQSFRRALQNGACTSSEYEVLKEKLDLELKKIASDYLEPYRESVNAYKLYVKWYQGEDARKRLASFGSEMRIAYHTARHL